MLVRYLSGILLVAILVPFIWFGNTLSFFILSLILIVLVEKELLDMLYTINQKLYVPVCLAGVAAWIISVYYHNLEMLLGTIICILICSFFIYWLQQKSFEMVLYNISFTLFAIVYAGLLVYVPLLRNVQTGPDGRYLVLFLLAVTYAGDTGAYHTGKSIGRHKLSPRVSPNKTLEGSIGGVTASILAGIICRILFFKSVPLHETIILSILINLLGQFGDLAESTIKRATGIKDSGTIIPGHGGILDRTDSLFFSAPFLYYYWYYHWIIS